MEVALGKEDNKGGLGPGNKNPLFCNCKKGVSGGGEHSIQGGVQRYSILKNKKNKGRGKKREG